MPVEHVVLVHLHQVQVVSDHRLGDVVTAGVQEDASVGEARRVHDLGPVDDGLDGVTELHGGVDQLAEGLEAPENAPSRESDYPGPTRLVRGVDLDLICILIISLENPPPPKNTYNAHPCPCGESSHSHSCCSSRSRPCQGNL